MINREVMRAEILLDLFQRMADHIDNNGMDPNEALRRAAEEMVHDMRLTAAQATADAFRAAGIKAQ